MENRLPGATIPQGYTEEEALQSVGKGWTHLIKEAFEIISGAGGTITQVKEKLGGLRIYFSGLSHDSPESKKIEIICDKSYTVCEACGDNGVLYQEGWWKTLCEVCYTNRKAGERDLARLKEIKDSVSDNK